MGFLNPILGGGGALVRPAIKSPNYSPGAAGWSINRDGTVEFVDGTFRGTITAAELIGSVFGSSTTDPSIWINEDNANSLRIYDGAGDLLIEIGADVGSQGSAVFYDSINPRAIEIGQQIQWLQGASILTPFAALYQTANAVLLNTQLAGGIGFDVAHGALSYVIPGSDTLETEHVVGTSGQPAFGGNFAAGTTSGTYGGLQFRRDGQDSVRLEGSWNGTAAITSSAVFTLPVGYRPKKARAVPVASTTSTGAVSALGLLLQVNASGVCNLQASAATAVGQNFHVNASIPLGNLA